MIPLPFTFTETWLNGPLEAVFPPKQPKAEAVFPFIFDVLQDLEMKKMSSLCPITIFKSSFLSFLDLAVKLVEELKDLSQEG